VEYEAKRTTHNSNIANRSICVVIVAVAVIVILHVVMLHVAVAIYFQKQKQKQGQSPLPLPVFLKNKETRSGTQEQGNEIEITPKGPTCNYQRNLRRTEGSCQTHTHITSSWHWHYCGLPI
jgi:hypothetical protein